MYKTSKKIFFLKSMVKYFQQSHKTKYKNGTDCSKVKLLQCNHSLITTCKVIKYI